MNNPKVLFYDVETTPLRAYIWRPGKQYVSHDNVMEGEFTKIICIAYRWQHEKKVHALVWDMEAQDCDDIIEEFSKVVEEADVAIAHNGDSFDVKHINTQRLMSGKPPIAWPTTEDSLKQLRQVFWLASYKLDYITKTLLGEGKSPMRFQDWIDIVEHKSEKALDKMVRYCKKDVSLLAEAYEIVQPYLKPRVSRALLTDGKCPSCGDHHVHRRGTATLVGGRYPRFQCQACGHWFRSRKKIVEDE